MRLAVTALLVIGLSGAGDVLKWRSVSLDSKGLLRAVLSSGGATTLRKRPDQTSFRDPTISPDGRAIGWLEMYPDPTVAYKAELGFVLVVWRAGGARRRFTTEQTFWDWAFIDGGKRVAYSTGPTHGGAAVAVLADVASGAVIQTWNYHDTQPGIPQWADNLRH